MTIETMRTFRLSLHSKIITLKVVLNRFIRMIVLQKLSLATIVRWPNWYILVWMSLHKLAIWIVSELEIYNVWSDVYWIITKFCSNSGNKLRTETETLIRRII